MVDQPGSAADVRIGVLGWIRASVDGDSVDVGGPRQQALLAALAARAGRNVASDVLIDAVWDGDPPVGAARTLRSYVARLRRSFDQAGVEGTSIVRTVSGGYRLDEAVAVDADVFESEVQRARAHLDRGELPAAVRMTGAALGRWEGPAFDPLADRRWAAPAAVRLEELRRDATELRARALLDVDRVSEAVALLEHHTRAEPYREEAVRLHALALYRAGRDADALRVLREFRDRLADDHGLDPSEQLSELEVLVLNRDPRLDRPMAGRRLRGYVVHEPIANSPLGTVHRAEQPSIGREVAVTVLPPAVADDPDVVRAFETRLQAVAGLHHPHVLPVYDYWREPGGAYVVTRLPAATLRDAVHAGRVTAAHALGVGEQVASAVAAAHERGIVHGAPDLDAVVVDERGDAYLWAFPLVPEPALPAADVAAVAAFVTAIAEHDGGPDGGDVTVDALPVRARTVLSRAQDPSGGPVVTAAGLAAALAAIRTGAAEPQAVPAFVGPNPYRGLAAFREADADVFFGRTDLVEQLIARIRRNRAVAVVGPSGSGKSSVVRAGVLPRFRAEGAFVTTMVPGARPLDELEVALARVAAVPITNAADAVVAGTDGLTRLVRQVLPTPGADLVLVVDQFEELFTQSDPTERDLFLAALADVVADHGAPVRVVATLRADFLGAALAHPTAARFVRDRTVMVAPLDDDELHEVIVGPAEVAGAVVEPALVTALVADATRARGSLPMVQFALTEVFAAADDGVMRLETYRRIGGIEGVLGQRAEEVFSSLDDGGQHAAELLFLRLVGPQQDGPTTRRRALRSELEHVPGGVIEAFGRARLLRFDRHEKSREPTVEVAHEALFVAWPRLATWIEEDEDDLRILGHLSAAATAWEDGGRDASELYRGTRLTSALAFADSHQGWLSASEGAFLDEARQRETAEDASTRRTTRLTRRLMIGLAAVVAMAVVGGLAAVDQRRHAQEQQSAAAAQDIAAAALDVTADDPALGVLLALEAVKQSPRTDGAVLPEAASALHRAVTTHRHLLTVPDVGGNVAWHPDGIRFVTEAAAPSGRVDFRDAATGDSLKTIAAHDADVLDLALSPDGSLLATSAADGLLRVWDTDTADLVAEVEGRGDVWGISFSPDGSRVAAAWQAEALVRVQDLTGGAPAVEISASIPGGPGDSTAFDHEGRRLAIAVDQGGVLVVDSEDGATQRRLGDTTVDVTSVAWSPDGRWIATAGSGDPGVVDAATGERHAALEGHDGQVLSLDWHPDGDRVATVAMDGFARVFEVTRDGAEERLTVATGGALVTEVAFSPGGDMLITGDDSTTSASVWDVGPGGGAEIVNLPTARDRRTDAAFTPDGDSVVVSGETMRAVVWDLATRTSQASLGEHLLGGARNVEVSPDGELVVTVTGDDPAREVQAWGTMTGELRFTFSPADVHAWAAAWSPDGEQLAVAGLGFFDGKGTIGVGDRNGKVITTLIGDKLNAVLHVAFSPDGRQVVTVVGHPAGDTGRVLLWDLASQEVSAELPVSARGAAFDPSGTRIAVRMAAGGVSIWDADTAERVMELDGHSGPVLDMAFSPDGQWMATSGTDRTIRLWSTTTGAEHQVLRGHDGPVWSVAFSPDGGRLVSTGNGLARVWALDVDELVEIAESRVARSLTDAECQQYLEPIPCPE